MSCCVTAICRLQADVGPCDNFETKWHFNSLTQACEEFTYGGCLGNHNNFQSREQCSMYCDASRWQPRATTEAPDIVSEGSGDIEVVTGIGILTDDTLLSMMFKGVYKSSVK